MPSLFRPTVLLRPPLSAISQSKTLSSFKRSSLFKAPLCHVYKPSFSLEQCGGRIYGKKLAIKLLTIISLSALVGACSTVTVSQDSVQKSITKQRGNIVTTNNLSSQTLSNLTSLGIKPEQCMANMIECLDYLQSNAIHKYRRSLAMYAELNIAKANELMTDGDCQAALSRPPINPYYPNQLDALTADKQRQQGLFEQCQQDYRNYLLGAIRTSYAFIFYEQLDKTEYEQTYNETASGQLVSDLDIQTQDIYEVASDTLIKYLYHHRHRQDEMQTPFMKIELLEAIHDQSDTLTNSKPTTTFPSNSDERGLTKRLVFSFAPIPTENIETEDMKPEEHIKVAQNHPHSLPIMDNRANIDLADLSELNRAIEAFNQINHSSDTPQEVALRETIPPSPIQITGNEKLQLTKVFNEPATVNIYLPNESLYLQHTKDYKEGFEALYTSRDLNFTGLNTISKRDGVGISYVALLNDRLNTSIKSLLQHKGDRLNDPDPLARIHMTGNLLLTGVVIPKGNSVSDVLTNNTTDIRLYDPYHTRSVDILDTPYDLSANFSASYGMWLAENRLQNVGYFNLLSKQQTLRLPQLFMLEPYDPNKRIIIMLHGLASSPATWVSVTNDISNDPVLRDNYQVWQIFYPTNIPMIENRYRIQKLIETAYQENDPTDNDPASHHSVLIGHSMGAVIGRMLLSDENLETDLAAINETQQNRQLNKLINAQLDEQNVTDRLHLHKLKPVNTAVFISAPFKGTDFADRWFTRALRRIIKLPIGFAKTLTGNLASIATEGELAANPLGALYLENGASQLSAKSSFIQLTKNLTIADGITYHSIIASQDSDLFEGLKNLDLISAPSINLPIDDAIDETMPDTQAVAVTLTAANPLVPNKDNITQKMTNSISDGIVPYDSAHLEGAASETVIAGGHSIQESPQAVLTLRHILHRQLSEYPPINHTHSADDVVENEPMIDGQ